MKAAFHAPTIGVFDSGVGGLSIFMTIQKRLPAARFYYLSDNLNFPYGSRSEEDVVACTLHAVTRFIAKCNLDILVIACNTASTVALPHLRSRLTTPVVGVVPAIKPAAALTKTNTIALLATPGTVRRPYTDELIASFAPQCLVIKTGSTVLVHLAELKLRGEEIDHAMVAAEVEDMFAQSPREEGRQLDTVVLGCTHFPLLLPELEAVAPWPVQWIDSSAAIAARTDYLVTERQLKGDGVAKGAQVAFFTKADQGVDLLRPALTKLGFAGVEIL